MPFQTTLPAKPELVEAMQNVPLGTIENRFRQWVTGQGATILDGPAIYADGRIGVTTDQDLTAQWGAFVPGTPTPTETQENTLQAEYLSIMREARDGTATAARVRRGLYLVMRLATRTYFAVSE